MMRNSAESYKLHADECGIFRTECLSLRTACLFLLKNLTAGRKNTDDQPSAKYPVIVYKTNCS
jgi:hypothetical protein